jgi:HlyD family secretion protein
VNLESRTAFLAALALAGMAMAIGSAEPAAGQEGARAARVEAPEDKRWQAVAPGRVESISGEIKIGAPLIAPIAEVLVKAGDKVTAGEPLLV